MRSDIVRRTPVRSDDRDILVSTIRTRRGEYSTVIFDESQDKANVGKWVGEFQIGCTNVRSFSRESAMDEHREALFAARTELVQER